MPERVFVLTASPNHTIYGYDWSDIDTDPSAATAVWSFTQQTLLRYRGAVAPNGEVYTVSRNNATGTQELVQLWKHSPWGDYRWRYRHHGQAGTGNFLWRVAVSAGSSVAAIGSASNETGNPHLRVLDQWGRLLFSAAVGSSTPYAVAWGPDETIYVGAQSQGSPAWTLRKFELDEDDEYEVAWSRDYLGGVVYAIAVDSDENVYVAGENASSEIVLAKFNAAGTQQWSRNLGNGDPGTLTLESDGVVLSGATRTVAGDPERSIAKYNLSTGADVWVYEATDGESSHWAGCHVRLDDGSYLLGITDTWVDGDPRDLIHLHDDGSEDWVGRLFTGGGVTWLGAAVVPAREEIAPSDDAELAFATITAAQRLARATDKTTTTVAEVKANPGFPVTNANACDPDKNFYGFGSIPSTHANRFAKHNADGTQAFLIDWSSGKSSETPRMAAFNDAADQVALVCRRITAGGFSFTTRAWSAAGTLLWQHDRGGGDARCIACDSAGHTYVGGTVFSSANIHKLDDAGGVVWARNYDSMDIRGILCTPDGGVLVGGLDGTLRVVAKFDADGVREWRTPTLTTGTRRPSLLPNGSSVWPSGGAGANFSLAGSGVTALDQNGNHLWQLAPPDYESVVDTAKNVVYVGNIGGSGVPTFYRINMATGYAVETRNLENTRGHLIRLFVPPVLPDAMPGLPLPLGLGLPEAYVIWVTQAPGLPLPLGMAPPTFDGVFYSEISSHPIGVPLGIRPALPMQELEYTGARVLPVVYRAGAIGSAVFQLQQVLARKTHRGVEVTVTGPDAPGLAGNEGETLVIRAGLRLPDGTEVVDVLFSVPITRIQSRRGTATITGYQAEDRQGNTRIRQLRGIQYRASGAGRVQVRCVSDHYLTPGDTALLPGGESFVVNEIAYVINNQQSTMDVTG